MRPELRQAFRSLRRSPGFAATSVLILGLGCATTAVIFSVFYGLLIRDLPYPQPERLVALGARLPNVGFPKANAGAADYFDWRRRQQVFTDLALTRLVANFNLTGGGMEPERIRGARATASLFPTLGIRPLIGRTFTETEQLDPQRASSVIVLSYALWQRRFGGDPAILNTSIRVNGASTQIIGVMPPDFRYPSPEFELWAPLYYRPQDIRDRMDFSYASVARLRPGITLKRAQTEMDAIAASLAREYPKTNQNVGVYVEPLLGNITETVRPVIWLLVAAVGTLFLVACINLANLLIARATQRQTEFAIRAALGATPSRLACQSFVETMPLAIAGAAAGILGSDSLLKLLLPLLPPNLPRLQEIAINTPVLLFTLGLSFAVALAVSIAPALQAVATLQRGPIRTSGLRSILLSTEIACTVVLLTAAGVLARGFVNLRATNPGFRPDDVLTLQFAVDRSTHGFADTEVWRYISRLIDSVQSVPAVKSVAVVNRLPMGGQAQTLTIEFEGHATSMSIDSRSVSPEYFQTMGIPVLAGRTFRDDETAERAPVGIIDERIARQVFGKASPLGSRFRIAILSGMPWVEVVGVVGHIRHEGLDRDPRPQVYWPYAQRTQDRVAMVLKTGRDPGGVTSAVRAAIRGVDPNQPLYEVSTMPDVVARTLLTQRLNVILISSFSLLALVLAGLGVYGVVSHLTTLRFREFGVRLAIGAKPAGLLAMVLRQTLTSASVGLGAGILLSVAVTRLLKMTIHAVAPIDPFTYMLAVVLLLIVVVAASYIPARKASRIDPASILRND